MIKRKIFIYLTFFIVILFVIALKFDIKSNEAEAQCVDVYQPGMMCGLYWYSQNAEQINVRCQGIQVDTSCPAGFSHEDFGYIETGSGYRLFTTCFKT